MIIVLINNVVDIDDNGKDNVIGVDDNDAHD